MDSPELVEDWQVCYYSSKSSAGPAHSTTAWLRLSLGLVEHYEQSELTERNARIVTLSDW